MITKVIKYEDFDGNLREETHHFHLSEVELTELQASVGGGLDKKIEKMIQTKEPKDLVNLMKDVIQLSYGIKSNDGKRFEKSPELTKEFMETNAYVELYLELASNDAAAAEFINGLLPKKLRNKLEAMK